jgi:hypothetical protein
VCLSTQAPTPDPSKWQVRQVRNPNGTISEEFTFTGQ